MSLSLLLSFQSFLTYLHNLIPSLLYLPPIHSSDTTNNTSTTNNAINITKSILAIPSNEELICKFIQSTNTESLHITLSNTIHSSSLSEHQKEPNQTENSTADTNDSQNICKYRYINIRLKYDFLH